MGVSSMRSADDFFEVDLRADGQLPATRGSENSNESYRYSHPITGTTWHSRILNKKPTFLSNSMQHEQSCFGKDSSAVARAIPAAERPTEPSRSKWLSRITVGIQHSRVLLILDGFNQWIKTLQRIDDVTGRILITSEPRRLGNPTYEINEGTSDRSAECFSTFTLFYLRILELRWTAHTRTVPFNRGRSRTTKRQRQRRMLKDET